MRACARVYVRACACAGWWVGGWMRACLRAYMYADGVLQASACFNTDDEIIIEIVLLFYVIGCIL